MPFDGVPARQHSHATWMQSSFEFRFDMDYVGHVL